MNWYKIASPKEITQPFYRITSPIVGTGGIGPGTYWTPRWESILMMCKTVWNYYHQMKKFEKKPWPVKIYKLTNALMQDSPKEHKWSFSYQPDAGEQVLIQVLSEPEIVVDTTSTSPEFLEMVDENVEYPVDYGSGEKIGLSGTWNGQQVFFSTNYQKHCIEVAIRNKDGWSFQVIKELRNPQEIRSFMAECKLPPNFDEHGAIDWFIMDEFDENGQLKEREQPKITDTSRRRRRTFDQTNSS